MEKTKQKVIGKREKIKKVFKELRKIGIYSRMDYKCCQSCGSYSIGDDASKSDFGYAFFHSQDGDDLRKKGVVHIAYGSLDKERVSAHEVGMLVASALANEGLEVFWEKDDKKRIQVGREQCSKWSCDSKAQVFYDGHGVYGYCQDHEDEADDNASKVEEYEFEPLDEREISQRIEKSFHQVKEVNK